MAVFRVVPFVNGMVMAFDEAGQQVPNYQGRYEEVVAKIVADFPTADWSRPREWEPGQARKLADAKAAAKKESVPD